MCCTVCSYVTEICSFSLRDFNVERCFVLLGARNACTARPIFAWCSQRSLLSIDHCSVLAKLVPCTRSLLGARNARLFQLVFARCSQRSSLSIGLFSVLATLLSDLLLFGCQISSEDETSAPSQLPIRYKYKADVKHIRKCAVYL